jgi:hypothetical protein
LESVYEIQPWRRRDSGRRASSSTPYDTASRLFGGRIGYFQRLPPFYQVDLRIDRRIVYDKFLLNFYVELVNATWSRQVYAVSQDGTGQVKERSFRIVLPSIGLRAEF